MKYKELNEYILNQTPENSINLGYWYIKQDNPSAALTYFLKAAETKNIPNDLLYECLMMISYSYKILGERWSSVKQYALFAKTIFPERPESYLMTCENNYSYINAYYDDWESPNWFEMYENSKIGLIYADDIKYKNCLYYNGKKYLEMYYCIALLNLNKHDELKQFLNKINITDLTDDFILNNYIYIYDQLRLKCEYNSYSFKKMQNLKIKFNNIEKVKQNYSQVMQDMFVLTVLNGKTNGTYLEIGAGDPIYGNNTKLLEDFGWKGISIDWSDYFLHSFLKERKNPIINQNALEINYPELFKSIYGNEKIIDYLSLDIDPAENTLKCLCKLPLNEYKFNVITFEHDSYHSPEYIKAESRKILESFDYILVGKNIKCNMSNSFEDWYIHKSIYVNLEDKIKSLFVNDNGVPEKIFFNHD